MKLYDLLKQYGESEYYGFHMPGHKRNQSFLEETFPFEIDITEIEGFDDLHHASGILKEAQERAAQVFGAEETHFLVNGSTVGILSAILGVTEPGDKVLVSRNCHKSVYHAIELRGLEPIFLYPDFDHVTGLNEAVFIDEIEDVKAIIIVSPTYDGVVSKVEDIAGMAHEKGIPLIVDEAHGAHFGFHSYFPQNSNSLGADIVIHSLHKTLPALTQTALLHMNGNIVDREKVRRYLRILQTSSPSYVLMASMDSCVAFLEKNGAPAFEKYVKELQRVRKELSKLRNLCLVEGKVQDRSKLIISVKDANITSTQLEHLLREKYKLQAEMTAGDYVMFMTSVADSPEGFVRLEKALSEIDRSLEKSTEKHICRPIPCAQKSGEGKVAEGYIYLYPPGVPILCPGEIITQEIREYLDDCERIGLNIMGDEHG